MLLPISLLLLVASALAADKCGKLGSHFSNRRRRLILGGQEIEARDVPWIVRIDSPRGFECTGTLISHRHVLTSAHCFETGDCKENFDPDLDFSVCHQEDTNNEKCEESRKFRIKEVLLLDRYLKSNCNRHLDIVILELNRPVLTGTRICVPSKDIELNYENGNDSEAHLLGYSRNNDFDLSVHDNKRLTHATTTVNLFRREQKPTLVSPYDARAGLCAGDSGGPMFEIHKKKAVLIGVNRGAVGGDCKIDEIVNQNNFNSEQRTVELRQHLDLIRSILLERGIELN